MQQRVIAVLTVAFSTWLLASAPSAGAADHHVSGERLSIKDSRTSRDSVISIRRSLSFESRDPGVLAPASGGAADPSIVGATLHLLNGNGTGESVAIALPAAAWERRPTDPALPLRSWRFRQKTNPKISVDITNGRLKARVSDRTGSVLSYTLDETSQGGMDVVVVLGGDRICASFAGIISSDQGVTGAECYVKGSFFAKSSPAPGTCADPASGTGANGDCSAIDTLEDFILGEMSDAHILGLAVAVVANGRVEWAKGFGSRRLQPSLPVTADTPFMLASISKVFTGTAVLQAVEDGAFGLNDNINSILSFTVNNPKVSGETISVRHLLTHTSGLVDNDSDALNEPPGAPGSLYVFGDSPIALGNFLQGYYVPGGTWYQSDNFNATQPGASYEYSNIATALAGQLLEDGTGLPLDDHCDARIFAPLGMSNTGWHLADFDANDVAVPYEYFGSQYDSFGQYGYPDYPDGQLRTSVTDLARFVAAYANGGVLEGQRILEQATVDQMFSVQYPGVDADQGLSWFHSKFGGRDVIGHDGADYGVSTDMAFDPATGVGTIVLMNVEDTNANYDAANRIKERLFLLGESAP